MAHATGNPAHIATPITADVSALSERDREILSILREAVQVADRVYLAQMRRESFIEEDVFETARIPLFYPEDATKEEIEQFLSSHPERKAELLDPFTVVIRDGERFAAVPYAAAHENEYAVMRHLLLQAADRIEQQAMRAFLEARADAFATNSYRESDIVWISANDSPFELTIGPFESYADTFFGVKRTFEAILGLIRPEDTERAKLLQEQIQRYDERLSTKYGYTSSPTFTPMVVIDEITAAGESLYDYVPMAYNLPNDRDIHAEVGSKKVFIRNVMDAKMRLITKPIADRVLSPEFHPYLDLDTVLLFVIGHEASHGLSFHFTGEEFGSVHSSLEECKADVFGILFLYFLAQNGHFDSKLLDKAVITHLADCVRQVRFKLTEAHAIGALVQFNWLMQSGTMHIEDGRLAFDPSRFHLSFEALGNALFALSQTKDENAALEFTRKWGTVPDGLEELVMPLADIPVDIDPQFSIV